MREIKDSSSLAHGNCGAQGAIDRAPGQTPAYALLDMIALVFGGLIRADRL